VRDELALVSGENLERLAEVLAREIAERRAARTMAKMGVLDHGELRAVQMRERKPIR
jgi:hypothetical protein